MNLQTHRAADPDPPTDDDPTGRGNQKGQLAAIHSPKEDVKSQQTRYRS